MPIVPLTPSSAQTIKVTAYRSLCDAILGLGFSPHQRDRYAFYAFTGVTPFNQINFFLSVPARRDFGTYTIDFSYTPQAVNALSSASPSANIGADETLLGSFTLSGGAAPSTLTFTGNTFTYDPAMGNLLMTINISGAFRTVWRQGGSTTLMTPGSVTSRAFFGPQNWADSTGTCHGIRRRASSPSRPGRPPSPALEINRPSSCIGISPKQTPTKPGCRCQMDFARSRCRNFAPCFLYASNPALRNASQICAALRPSCAAMPSSSFLRSVGILNVNCVSFFIGTRLPKHFHSLPHWKGA